MKGAFSNIFSGRRKFHRVFLWIRWYIVIWISDNICKNKVKIYFSGVYHHPDAGALIATDLRREEFEPYHISPAYKAYEQEQLDLHKGPDAMGDENSFGYKFGYLVIVFESFKPEIDFSVFLWKFSIVEKKF